MAESSEKFLIVFTGGGSGGHIYPLIAVAEALRRELTALNAPYEYFYMGGTDSYTPVLKEHGMTMSPIVTGKMRRYLSLQNIIDIPKFFIGFLQALFKLYFIMPDVVFSKGGTGALPVVIAAWFYRIPVTFHESDAQPGLNNLLSAYFAKRIFLSFDRAATYFNPAITQVVGSPLREELLVGRTTKELARENFGFEASKPLVLILGGSQGSARLNEFVLTNLAQFLEKTQVLHQAGKANFLDVQKLSHAALIESPTANRYQVVDYLSDADGHKNEMALALTAADLVIARSGSSVFEFAAFGLPAILVPLAQAANGHQLIDAMEFSKTGAALVIEEDNLLPGLFFGQLNALLGDPELLAKMSAASSAFFKPGAAEAIAKEIVAIVAG